MFFLKSIRRRLVTGFTVALILMLMMTAAAIWGLLRHQTALSELDHLVHHSPDKAQLLERVNLILYPLTEAVDLSRDDAVNSLRNRYRQNVESAQAEADEFWRRSEQAAQDPRKHALGFSGRHNVLQSNLTAVKHHLEQLHQLARRIDFFDTTSQQQRIHHLNTISMQAHLLIVRITKNVHRLPAYDKEKHVVAPLQAEGRQSARLLRQVLILTFASLVTYAMTIYCGLRWISNPLRMIAKGASRIANGDTDYRLGQVTPWKDEFFDLTENFNRMANRFQESEDDLSAKVEERSRQLVRSERLASVGFLAAGLAHEINNPLQSITMAAESLQMRLYDHLDPEHADTVEAMERLAMIQRESKRCGGITRKLLDFSRNDCSDSRQDGQPEKQLGDFTQVITEVIAMVRPINQYQDRSIVFSHSAPLLIEMNQAQMKQVILNLLANGLQATSEGGTVEIRLRDQTDWVVIEIRDNGQGMTEDNIQHLFEPFFSTKETGRGTGLGLSITHRIVEDHHGTIDPFSEGPGSGSTFSIRLPRRQPRQKAA